MSLSRKECPGERVTGRLNEMIAKRFNPLESSLCLFFTGEWGVGVTSGLAGDSGVRGGAGSL